jgi:hypothetical protein
MSGARCIELTPREQPTSKGRRASDQGVGDHVGVIELSQAQMPQHPAPIIRRCANLTA